MVSAAHGAGGVVATGSCLTHRRPAPAPNMGRRVPKPRNKPGPSSPLVTAWATRRNEAGQTAAQFPPPLPAGETPGNRDGARARGSGKSRGARKQLPNHSFKRVFGGAWPQLWGAQRPAPSGHPPPWPPEVGKGTPMQPHPQTGTSPELPQRPSGSRWSRHRSRAPVPRRDVARVHT